MRLSFYLSSSLIFSLGFIYIFIIAFGNFVHTYWHVKLNTLLNMCYSKRAKYFGEISSLKAFIKLYQRLDYFSNCYTKLPSDQLHILKTPFCSKYVLVLVCTDCWKICTLTSNICFTWLSLSRPSPKHTAFRYNDNFIHLNLECTL